MTSKSDVCDEENSPTEFSDDMECQISNHSLIGVDFTRYHTTITISYSAITKGDEN